MDGDPPVFFVEHGDELQPCAEGVEVLAQCGDPDVLGVLELRDRTLGDVEAAGELGSAHGRRVAQLVEPDLLERLGLPQLR